MDDPDAAGALFTYWVLFDLSADTRALPQALPTEAELASGARHGKNDFGRVGYGGPCPPGGTHRYRFTLYALDQPLGVAAGVARQEVQDAMQGHILGEIILVGKYRH